MQTYANATLCLDGRAVPIDDLSVEFSDANDWLVVPSLTSTERSHDYTFTFTAEFNGRDMKRLRRFAAGNFCWKCHDGRTRAHHRACRWRGGRGHGGSFPVYAVAR